MSTTRRNGSTSTTGDIEQDTAVGRAEAGASGWEDTVRLQRWAAPDHADFYALAGEIVATLHALEALARVMSRQVAGYANGRAVYDDTRQVDPTHRLIEAAADMDTLAEHLRSAERSANAFWSGIGHVGVEAGQPGGQRLPWWPVGSETRGPPHAVIPVRAPHAVEVPRPSRPRQHRRGERVRSAVR